MFGEFGFGVEEIDVRWSAVLKEGNHRAGAGGFGGRLELKVEMLKVLGRFVGEANARSCLSKWASANAPTPRPL